MSRRYEPQEATAGALLKVPPLAIQLLQLLPLHSLRYTWLSVPRAQISRLFEWVEMTAGGLLKAPNEFHGACSLTLTRPEAEYLAERIQLSPGSAGSLLAELVAQQKRTEDVDFVWNHPHAASLPGKLAELTNNAQNFSEVMHGAPLLYNLILAEEGKRDDGVGAYRQRFKEWALLISNRSSALGAWNRPRFWELVRSINPRVTTPTYEFINTWWDFALAGDAARLRENATVRSLIRDREKRLKKTLARIGNPRAQELWNGDSGSAQLDFRWDIAQDLLRDIFDGLETADA